MNLHQRKTSIVVLGANVLSNFCLIWQYLSICTMYMESFNFIFYLRYFAAMIQT